MYEQLFDQSVQKEMYTFFSPYLGMQAKLNGMKKVLL